jgi:Dolichyl-phosphate-mannose-protein mannosyltransferase
VFPDDGRLYEAEATLLCVILCALALAALVRGIRRRRPELDLRLVVGVAFGARVAVVLAQGLLGSVGETIRLTDDPTSLAEANVLAHTPLSDELWRQTFFGDFHLTFFAGQTWLLGGPGGTPLRIVQGAIAVVAIALVALAVERMAGRRAALVAAWFLALEPTTVLFTTLLHKESFVFLGEAVFLLGLVQSWTTRNFRGAPLALAGIGVILLVRPYAGQILLAAYVVFAVYLLLSGLGTERRRHPAVAGVVVAALAGIALIASSGSPLERANNLQNEDPAVNDNLQLDPVDFTTVGGLAEGVPIRVRDFLLRPYPWQAANLSQRLGVAGTLIAWALYVLLAYGLITGGRRALSRAGPFVYAGAAITLTYALSTANAGAGYRHRIQLLLVLSAAVSAALADRLPSSISLPARRRPLAST